MSALSDPFLAPAPRPQPRPLSTPAFIWTAMRNPIEIWGERAYRERVLRNDWLRVPTVIVNDPATIRHCLVDNAANYAMQPLRQRVLRPMLRDGLLTAEGELWRRTRRAMAPVFTPRNVGGLAAIMATRSQAFAEALEQSEADAPRDVANEMTLLTYDILQATLFTDAIAGEPAEFARAMDDFLHRMGRIDPLDLLDAPAFLPRVGRLLGHRSTTYFRRLITETAERRRALIAADPTSAPRDLLTLLLQTEGLSASEVEDNIITFIGAGHETTARALGWTLYLLASAPIERDKVERELDEQLPGLPDPREWADALPRTRAALEEAMRLYPPAPSLNRMAIEADTVAGMEVPAGASLLVMPWLVHRHEALWERPGHFLPDRFAPENRGRIDRYQYIPFGVGPRVCIGASFALQEGVIALACLMRTLRFEYVGARPPHPVQKITVQPRGGLPMRVTRRRKSL
ncbi:cytochrome P450 [Aureimonas phyllosphaerae]|uniref:Cytochrome P450 n=1 Tax=Aureimonas phyllosphaerae TaxID=1166078 RepID=A0A7W6BV89_9HYPH|nr:cytochrome P450 [Aureimonas phyllosphaerae]MBB3937522.1 cytochrome P450 [Aureimonas phyllosphaerae]MBB3961412.1 cytochrome P450 [Aureimonas phyllosphaerae]SFF37860.1 Cytochrome P450 [Aureimonas phyllosphaerae]